MQPAIRVENLAKSYRISHTAERGGYKTLRESMQGLVSAAFRRGKKGGGDTTEEFWALSDVSFDVQPGEVVGIIGRNGAGKSTLLKILSRITKPTKGQVTLNGRVGSLLEVGTGFHPELSGRENIYLNGSILGMARREIDRQFDAIVDFSGVEKFLDTPVKRYSSGMYVRLAFSVAAHLEPEVLIIDEVLAVGDAEFQKKCLGKMGAVAKQGRTVLFVSHNMPAVRTLCTRGCYLEVGRVALNGSVEECVAMYLSKAMGDQLQPSVFYDLQAKRMQMTSARVMRDRDVTQAFNLGDPFTIEVDFRSERPTRQPILGFVISTEEGEPILNANNLYQNSKPPETVLDNGRITCRLGKVPFMPGKYSVSLWFGDQYTNHHIVESALTFEVLERDIWGAGKVPPKNCSRLWWPTEFEVA